MSRRSSAMPRRSGVVPALPFFVSLLLAACAPDEGREDPAGDGEPGNSRDPAHLEDVADVLPPLILEERDDALVVSPFLRRDPAGGWLYWDRAEEQARLYGEEGELVQVLGGPGDGPGEFSGLQALLRLEDGRLATADARGRIAIWDAEGDRVLHEFTVELPRILGATSLDGGRLALFTAPHLSGPDGVPGPLLHVVELGTEAVAHQGVLPHLTPENFAVAVSVESPAPRRYGGSVYVGLGVMDTLWALPAGTGEGGAGQEAEGEPSPLPIPSTRMAANPPPVPASQGTEAVRRWMEEATFLGDFVALDAGYLIQTWAFREDRARFDLLRLAPDGSRIWEVETSYRLLDASADGTLYLWDPEGTDPARIHVVRLRPPP